MPELCRFYSQYFHVFFVEYEASVGVDGELPVGSLPVKQLKLVQAWSTINCMRHGTDGDIDIAPEMLCREGAAAGGAA